VGVQTTVVEGQMTVGDVLCVTNGEMIGIGTGDSPGAGSLNVGASLIGRCGYALRPKQVLWASWFMVVFRSD